MQTNYAAGVESLKAAAKDLAIRYQHYSSGVVRLEVSLKYFTSIDCISQCQQSSSMPTAAETEGLLASPVYCAGGQLEQRILGSCQSLIRNDCVCICNI